MGLHLAHVFVRHVYGVFDPSFSRHPGHLADSLRPGWVKALWILGVLLFPLLGCLAYIMFYGQQMAIRQSARQDVAREDMAEYIRRTANTNPAEQIAAGKKLLDEGTITGDEFQMLKARALR